MKPYSMQELEECGFLSKIFGSKPTENGWKELNNLLAAAPDALAISADDVHHALKKWGVKFNDDNFNQRSGIYRKLADVIFTEVQNKEAFGRSLHTWLKFWNCRRIWQSRLIRQQKQLLILSVAVICLQAPKNWISNN
mgnify:CR=1 FL=1